MSNWVAKYLLNCAEEAELVNVWSLSCRVLFGFQFTEKPIFISRHHEWKSAAVRVRFTAASVKALVFSALTWISVSSLWNLFARSGPFSIVGIWYVWEREKHIFNLVLCQNDLRSVRVDYSRLSAVSWFPWSRVQEKPPSPSSAEGNFPQVDFSRRTTSVPTNRLPRSAHQRRTPTFPL